MVYCGRVKVCIATGKKGLRRHGCRGGSERGALVLWYSMVSYGKLLQQNMGTSTLALGGLGKSMINFAVTWCMQ